MAEMIPDTLPASSTAGERRLFTTLARLPDDCLVYYEPVVRRRYPDLIAILPEVGVLVIEVKDWRLAEVGSVNADRVNITRRGTATVVPHPRRQARGYMLRLMDECRRLPQAGVLMQKEGRHAGGYTFPFCHIAVLSNINRSQIEREAPELSLLFPSGTTITRDELATWDALEPHALLARLKACFDPWWAFPKLTPAQIDIFRSVIHPEVVIRASETNLAVLDLRQERNARALGDGHRIVYGVAGSGKTVLLVARAKLLAEDPEKRILMLCYNRLLAQHLAVALAGHGRVAVLTFHRWAYRCGVAFSEGEEDGAFGERLLARLRGDAGLRGRYDAVLIDEAQDWPCSWFQCGMAGAQGARDRRSADRRRWQSVALSQAGFHLGRCRHSCQRPRDEPEVRSRSQLPQHRRDPPRRTPVLRAGGGMQGVLALPVEPDTAIRTGPGPWLIRLEDAASEMHYAAALIETWLRGGVEIGGRRERVNPGDIAVLYPRRRPEAAVTALCDRLNGFTRAVLPTGDKPTGTLRDEAVKILPMHSARGLQFRIVLLLWADLLPTPFKGRDDGIDRSLLYVAITRAEDKLVILHSGSSSYVDELYRALGTLPP
jgi:hypothetical protein